VPHRNFLTYLLTYTYKQHSLLYSKCNADVLFDIMCAVIVYICLSGDGYLGNGDYTDWREILHVYHGMVAP